MKHEIKDTGQYLKSHGIKPSSQRIKIYDYLVTKKNHPTIDIIYKALAPKIPTLSKTTVYNTLKTFVEKKITDVIIIEENETRYDADTSIHGHFKCETCCKVLDLDIDENSLNIPGLNGHKVNEQHYYFKGVCPQCLNVNN